MLALLLVVALGAGEEVIARGGELDGPPERTAGKEGADFAAYGFAEVPGGSRLQAALALADANARAELQKIARVHVEDSLKANSTATTEEIESRTREFAHGLLPALALPQHGWRKLKRGDSIVLQVWARVSIPQDRFDELLKGVLK
jgi:hypothetical protein